MGEAIDPQTTGEPFTPTPFEDRFWDLLKADFRRRVQLLQLISKSGTPEGSSDLYGDALKEPGPVSISPRMRVRIILQPGSLATILHRVAHSATKNRIPLVTSIAKMLNFVLFSVDIDPEALIGPGLFLGHPFGVTIGPARIGRNVSILQFAGIGSSGKRDTRKDGVPMVGDNVWFMHHSGAAGPITVGSNSRLGANTLLLESCPPNSFVVPARSRVFVDPPPEW
jgi:serine O-acetyltransferase